MSDKQRRDFIKLGVTTAVLLGASSSIVSAKNEPKITNEWDKIFPKSDKVKHKRVTFKNRYNITLVGDLYIPKNANGALPAIAVSGPYGAVKEQSSGLYAQKMAEAGFVTLAFDPSFMGGRAAGSLDTSLRLKCTQKILVRRLTF